MCLLGVDFSILWYFFLSLLVHSRAKIAEMLIWSQKGLTMSFSFCFFRICCCVVYLSRHVKRIALNCVFFSRFG